MYLLEFISRNELPKGNKDLFRKSIYEKYWLDRFGPPKDLLPTSDAFIGCRYLEHERIDDVRTGHCKTFYQILSEFYNLDIHNSFGLSITDYMNFTPKVIDIIKKAGRDKLLKQEEIAKSLNNIK